MPYEHVLAYIQILLAVLLFALGIPALIVEASVEDRIRHLLHKRLPYWIVAALLIATALAIFGLLFVAKTGTSTIVNSRAIAPTTSVPRPHDRVVAAEASGGTASSRSDAWTVAVDVGAKLVTAALITAFAIIWWLMMRHDVEGSLVRRIERKLRGSFNRRGFHADEDLRDLISLGANGSSGNDKRVVIQAIARYAQRVQTSHRYDGTELAEFIHGLFEIVTNGERPGDEGNLLGCLAELRIMWLRLRSRGLRNDSDGIASIEVAALIGEFGVRSASDVTALHALDAVDDVPEIAFRIGKLATVHGRSRVAVAALNRLEALSDIHGSALKELVALAAYMFSAGVSSRLRVTPALAGVKANVIEHVASEYYDIGDFGTSDAVRKLLPPRVRSKYLSMLGLAVCAAGVLAALGAKVRRA